jgi:hypothetical protein
MRAILLSPWAPESFGRPSARARQCARSGRRAIGALGRQIAEPRSISASAKSPCVPGGNQPAPLRPPAAAGDAEHPRATRSTLVSIARIVAERDRCHRRGGIGA